ncbi:bifunctional 4-hydroxy-2-oxoglutarate aldolase/2-dehydro-3-deoxy-phosphogluconate aldolase [Wenyingzhuangia aestuarii]|uniref:bifunctional 4-hydroxy-2-oxoglutarate aldolase/2-dehydro-3-deoxy-phosphogluconate aldolase n=1 Tax=Wenyingzhuangia aestuarii TaxID=1647582 RepID=UPI00143CA614|nr:bifunctional 4-hydroxy-2-oxoglutarate aldolase/2-dehydro-3-deoxy-phosphogluconate aldolase [Wenyingzhuangia aestuarii]NJB84016.1 2-dehydro-3-deoxyphosphogluconate aldolase/(4S)-4-hydroxy-2-oxoglutarate aldolase [Wenyingzhuangia aestuarii]
MSKSTFSWEKYNETPVVGIMRGFSMEQIKEIIPVYIDSGFYTVEITMNSENAEASIATLAKEYPTLNVGAGTVCNMDDLKRALDAGSQFIVTPVIDEDVISYCVAHKIPVFPGAYTPTEIYKAWSLGASAVKIFPATQLGTKYIKDILGPLNTIKLLPTGGVDKNNIADFFKVGVVGCGMGGSLFDKNIIASGDKVALKVHFDAIKKATKI